MHRHKRVGSASVKAVALPEYKRIPLRIGALWIIEAVQFKDEIADECTIITLPLAQK
jgi:hypothetical protein